METLLVLAAIWWMVFVLIAPCGILVTGLIALTDPKEFAEITRRKRMFVAVLVILWPITGLVTFFFGVYAGCGIPQPAYVQKFFAYIHEDTGKPVRKPLTGETK